MNTSKAAVGVNAVLGKVSSIVGYFLGACGLIGLAVEISENRESSGFVVGFVFVAVGVFLILKGAQIKRRIKRFKRYISLISTQQMTSLENIAASTAQSVDYIKKDLQRMIDKRFLVNASINVATNEINIGGVAASAVSAANIYEANTEANSEWEMFTCSGCGASGTKTKGVPGNCDYCGSLVQ